MAGKNDQKVKTGSAGGNMSGPPNGYRQMSADTDAPWWKAEEGAVCHGELLGFYTMQGVEPARSYYQLKLLDDAKGWKGKGDDRVEVDCPKGSIINLGENFKVADLRRIVPEVQAGARYNVFVKIKGAKMKVGNAGHTMWPMDIFSKMVSPPTSQVVRNLSINAAVPGTDSDVPF